MNLSDSYGSFDTHISMVHDNLSHMIYVIKCQKIAFYDILWHISYDIKCNKQYGYQKNRMNLTNSDVKNILHISTHFAV